MKRTQKLFQTESTILRLRELLIEDLKPMKASWFADPRNYSGPDYLYWKPHKFKVMYQLEELFKRVILSTDPPFDELVKRGRKDFVTAQEGFGLPRDNRIVEAVIQRARIIVADILGDFDFKQFARDCSFGKRAAVDLPYRESYLDVRASRLNGSKSQIEWFKAVLCEDIHLHRACRIGLKKAYIADYLELKAVPKTFKSARMMAPDTVIGGFLSRGLGVTLRRCLEARTHIDLRTQQLLHRFLAKQGSIDGKCCTIDMKRASDSYVWDHVLALVPETWHDIMKCVHTPVCIDGVPVAGLKSYMLMGSGHTFPLQTILFYSICKAVLELLGSRAKVNVYGDDIIFPTQYAHYVITSLHKCGFTVNVQKSFIDGPFRESCGGDYHSGVDVRPFMPEHTCGLYDKDAYTEILHQWANGLLARWSYDEIPHAYDFLCYEIVRVQGNLCPVPRYETDGAGLYFIPEYLSLFVRKPVYHNGLWSYLKLVRKPRKRAPKQERLYYWYSLRKSSKPFTNLARWIEREQWEVEPYDEPDPSLDKRGMEPKKGSTRFGWVTVDPTRWNE